MNHRLAEAGGRRPAFLERILANGRPNVGVVYLG